MKQRQTCFAKVSAAVVCPWALEAFKRKCFDVFPIQQRTKEASPSQRSRDKPKVLKARPTSLHAMG